MTDTITVTINGRSVVFERVKGDPLYIGKQWTHGALHLTETSDGDWVADIGLGCGVCGATYRPTAEEAIEELTKRANVWAPVLRELARLGGNDGKAE